MLCYYKYLFSRYAVGIVVTSIFCLFKSGFSQARIKKFKLGSFGKSLDSFCNTGVCRHPSLCPRNSAFYIIISDTAFAGQSSTKVDSFIIAGIEFMFGLALVALNAKGPKLIKNPILIVWLGALYCAYFWIYKNSRGNYPYSPYHLMNDYYLQL